MICPYCGKPAEWTDNSVLYGKCFGESYMIYLCKPCDAYVGCHKNSRRPLGTMANAPLRAWRVLAHRAIDPIWKSGRMSRSEVYGLLHENFGFDVHIGQSDMLMCRNIVSFARKWVAEHPVNEEIWS